MGQRRESPLAAALCRQRESDGDDHDDTDAGVKICGMAVWDLEELGVGTHHAHPPGLAAGY